jgi:hypothetical protein
MPGSDNVFYALIVVEDATVVSKVTIERVDEKLE